MRPVSSNNSYQLGMQLASVVMLSALTIFAPVNAQSQKISLNSSENIHWQFRKALDTAWYDATVPGCIHTDLLAHGLIPDPYFGTNESKVQWVENEAWEYEAFFNCPEEVLSLAHIELQFEGVDTYADIYLNDSLILRADNMFREWKVDVKKFLREKNNHLFIHFYSPVKKGNELANGLGYKLPGDEGGRAVERKAAYQFGWDWGPRLVTCGLWKEVKLAGFNNPADTQTLKKITGEKPQVIQHPDADGSSFYFQVDGEPLFIKGANLIPPDNFLSRVTGDDYKRLIDDALAAHINMLRVWGGGAYLPDEFYDYCDEKGMLIWQDFMFAGAMVPGDAVFEANVKEEAIEQVTRLGKHSCIALWCGNNEINEAWNNWGFKSEIQMKAGVNDKIWNDYLKIFDTILPQVVQEYDPGRFYWPSSPSTGWGHAEAFRQGDVHYWGVWWGDEPFSAYENHTGRFMSEYGFQSLPSMDCFYAFATPDDWKHIPADKKTASAVLNAHQKHDRGYELIHKYMEASYRIPAAFEKYAYVSQLLQRDGMAIAIEAHRRAKPYCMGTMYWQLNDCWPVTSWSSIDYLGQWKALHYALAHDLYKTFLVSVRAEKDSVAIHLVSDSSSDVNARLRVTLLSFDGKNKWGLLDSIVPVTKNSSRLVYSISLQKIRKLASSVQETKTGEPLSHYFLAAELSQDEEQMAGKNFFFVKPKDLSLPNPGITSEISFSRMRSPYEDYPNVYLIRLQATAFAKDVFLSYNFEEVKFSDNFFDMPAGSSVTVWMYAKEAIDYVNLPVQVISLYDAE